MRALLIGFILLLSACAAEPVIKDVNQPHLPPPAFPVSEPLVGKSCGGMIRTEGPECGEDEYCHRTIAAQCGAADAPGVCKTIPEICTMDFNPVCGCDGQTYANECAANAKGISAASAGECSS